MDAARPQHQQEEEQERKASMEKTAKVFSSSKEELEEADSSDADDEPVQNHRGWKAMPYVIGDCSSSSPSCLISLLLLCNCHAHTVLFPKILVRKTCLPSSLVLSGL